MSKTIQLYADNNNTIKAYPKTLSSCVFDESGKSVKEQMDSVLKNEIQLSNTPFRDEKASRYRIEMQLNSGNFGLYTHTTYGNGSISVNDDIVILNAVVNKLNNGTTNENMIVSYMPPEVVPSIVPVSNCSSCSKDWMKIAPQLSLVGHQADLFIDPDIYRLSNNLNYFFNINMMYPINKTAIPKYISDGVKSKILLFNELAGSKLVLGADMHCNPQPNTRFDNKNVFFPRVINYLGEQTSSFANIILGDIIDDGDSMSKEEGLKRLRSMRRLLSYKTLCVRGNHDGNSIRGDSTPEKYIHADLFKEEMLDGKSNIVTNSLKSYYYVDNYNDGIRYICLDGSDCPDDKNPSYTYVISQNQLDWLVKTLDSAPKDYHIVLCMHQSLLAEDDIPDMYDLYVNNANLAKGIIEAYSNKTTFSGVTTGDYSASVDVDFTEKATTNNKIVGFFFGHYHYDYKKQINGIWHIGLDSMHTENPYVITSPDAVDNSRSKGNISEVACDLVNINKDSSTVTMIRVGAGLDRSFTY